VDWPYYRTLFPVTQRSAFFNHAAISAPSTKVIAAVQELVSEQAYLGSQGYRSWMDRVETVRQQVARFVCAAPSDIAFVANTSTGLGLMAAGFHWTAGDALLVPSPDFPANVYPWQNLSQRGVTMITVPRRSGRLAVEDFARLVTDNVRMLVVSSVDFATGYAVDLNAIGRFCRENNIFFGVDAIQSLGVRPIDVEKDQIDFVAAGAHKWLLGPMGIGLLYISPRLRQHLDLPLVGWKSVVHEEDFRLHFQLRKDAAGFEPGTLNVAGIVGLGAAISLLEEVGLVQIEQRVSILLDELADGLAQRSLTLKTPWPGKERCGILSFTAGDDVFALSKHLNEQGVVLALRDGGFRLSPHFYNDAADIERFFYALDSFSG
jgi:selenocysteine lyase/cysteine desulfurase